MHSKGLWMAPINTCLGRLLYFFHGSRLIYRGGNFSAHMTYATMVDGQNSSILSHPYKCGANYATMEGGLVGASENLSSGTRESLPLVLTALSRAYEYIHM